MTMTYCVAMNLEQGLLFGGDTRTNAGVDHISTFRKLYTFSNDKTHALAILCSGNLGTSQALIELLRKEIRANESNLLNHTSLFDCAKHVGKRLREIIHGYSEEDYDKKVDFSGSLLLGGQIKGEAPRLFFVYPQGNFIESTRETPYFQIGEHKYGKPILERTLEYTTPLNIALSSMVVSLDSTIKSNLSVGLPMDVLIYEKDSFNLDRYRRFNEYDQEFLAARKYWLDGLRRLIEEFPELKV